MYQEFRTEIEEGVPNNGGTGRVDIASFLVGHAYLNREGDVDRTMSYTLGRHGDTKPRNPHDFDTFEGGTPRVYQALMVTIQSVKAIYSGKTTLSDTFWRPGGV